MIIFAIYSISAATSCEKKTKISAAFLIEKVSSCIANIKLRITSCQCGLFLFFVFRTNVFGIPKVVLLIALFIRIIVGQRGLNLLSCRPLFSISKGNPFSFFFLKVLFWYVFVDIEPKFRGFGFELSKVCLDSFMKLFG